MLRHAHTVATICRVNRFFNVFVWFVAVFLLTPPRVEAQPTSAFLWRIESISAEAVHKGASPVIGSHLRLRQSLRQGESGWTEMKIAIPAYWNVQRSFTEGDNVLIELGNGQRFALHRDNVTVLSNRLLGIGKRLPDPEIQLAWEQVAKLAAK